MYSKAIIQLTRVFLCLPAYLILVIRCSVIPCSIRFHKNQGWTMKWPYSIHTKGKSITVFRGGERCWKSQSICECPSNQMPEKWTVGISVVDARISFLFLSCTAKMIFFDWTSAVPSQCYHNLLPRRVLYSFIAVQFFTALRICAWKMHSAQLCYYHYFIGLDFPSDNCKISRSDYA